MYNLKIKHCQASRQTSDLNVPENERIYALAVLQGLQKQEEVSPNNLNSVIPQKHQFP